MNSYIDWLCKKYKAKTIYPYINLPTLNRLDPKLNTLINTIVGDIKEVFVTPKYYMRYDLTLPFICKGINCRSEIGTVYRLGPESKYRWREFIQADSDSQVFSNKVDMMCKLLDKQVEFLNKLPVEYELKINYLPILYDYIYESKEYLKKIDLKQVTIEKSEYINLVVKKYLDTTYKFNFNYTVDCNIVRGLHMYNGLVYEIYFKNCRFAMGAGGEYKISNISNTQYIGASLGLSRIAEYLKDHLYKIPCIYYKTKMELSTSPYISTFYMDTSFKNIFKKFKQYPLIIIRGINEISRNKYTIKYLTTYKQTSIDFEDLKILLTDVNSYRTK